MSNSNRHDGVRVRVRDTDGRAWYVCVSARQAKQLAGASARGALARVLVDDHGRVTAVLSNGESRLQERLVARFRLRVDPSEFEPFVPDDWEVKMEQILEADIRPRVLLYGPEGTGKDTFAKRLIFGGLRDKATNLEVLTIPAEYDDRYVGHLENKAKEFGQAVEEAKRAGSEVGVYLPEIERHFAVGDYHYSWEDKYTAALRDVIHGTQAFPADWVLATTNHLARLGAPLLSRFYKIELPMSLELARGILQTHWPAESANGLSPDYVLERLRQETIAEVTLASRKTAALRAPDLTGFNGRFLRDFAADLETRIKLQRRKQAHFAPDAAFADQILAEHVRAILAPVMEAVGTRAVREFLVTLPDPLDPPVAIKPCLDGFQRARFLAS